MSVGGLFANTLFSISQPAQAPYEAFIQSGRPFKESKWKRMCLGHQRDDEWVIAPTLAFEKIYHSFLLAQVAVPAQFFRSNGVLLSINRSICGTVAGLGGTLRAGAWPDGRGWTGSGGEATGGGGGGSGQVTWVGDMDMGRTTWAECL